MAVLAIIAIVSLWTPLSHPAVAARWFSLPNIVFFAPVPILVLLVYMGDPTHAPAGQPCCAVSVRTGPLVPGLQRACHQPVAEHYPAVDFHLGRGRASRKYGLHAGGGALHHPIHTRLHHMVLLRLSRQGENGRGISLMRIRPCYASRKWLNRVGWLILIWVTSVAALGTVALVLRAIMSVAGMTV